MKKIMIMMAALTLSAATAHAQDSYFDMDIMNGVESKATTALETCLNATNPTRQSLRACNTSMRLVVPRSDIRSAILTKRAFLNLSAGKIDNAARDFKYVHKMGQHPDYALLGEGFTALMKADYDKAMVHFDTCSGLKSTAPLAAFGRAMTRELAGDVDGARKDYIFAAELVPGWEAPRAELARLDT